MEIYTQMKQNSWVFIIIKRSFWLVSDMRERQCSEMTEDVQRGVHSFEVQVYISEEIKSENRFAFVHNETLLNLLSCYIWGYELARIWNIHEEVKHFRIQDDASKYGKRMNLKLLICRN